MDTVSAVSYANSLLQIAEKKEDTAQKRQLYLEAAEHYMRAAKTADPAEKQRFLVMAQELYTKAQSMRQANFEQIDNKPTFGIKKSKINFQDVAGLQHVKEDIRMKIIEPLKSPEIFKHFGKKAGGGILMYGPPGCGKSLIAEATAGEAGVAFFNIKASDIKSKYVGETEQNIARLFDEARKEKASIIFFDEFEALGTERSRIGVNMKGAVSQLLTEMDGVGNKDQNILVIAATNEPWNIDLALRRPGRFDRAIFIPPPDKIARFELMKHEMKNRPCENIFFDAIAKVTEGYSGAELKAVCEAATEIPLREYLNFGVKRKISNEDFYDALLKVKPSTDRWFMKASYVLKQRNESSFPEIQEYLSSLKAVAQ